MVITQMLIMKPLVTEPRQRLRRGAVKRFLQEDYVVKKHNHTCDYTMDMSMYLSDAARLPHVPARAVVRSGHRTTARAVKKN